VVPNKKHHVKLTPTNAARSKQKRRGHQNPENRGSTLGRPWRIWSQDTGPEAQKPSGRPNPPDRKAARPHLWGRARRSPPRELQDNLNTRTPASLYKASEPEKAGRLVEKTCGEDRRSRESRYGATKRGPPPGGV